MVGQRTLNLTMRVVPYKVKECRIKISLKEENVIKDIT